MCTSSRLYDTSALTVMLVVVQVEQLLLLLLLLPESSSLHMYVAAELLTHECPRGGMCLFGWQHRLGYDRLR